MGYVMIDGKQQVDNRHAYASDPYAPHWYSDEELRCMQMDEQVQVGGVIENVKENIGLLLGGVAATYAAGVLPKGMGGIVRLGGMAAIVLGVFGVLGDSKAEAAEEIEAEPVPVTPVAHGEVSGKFVDPADAGVASRGLFSSTYPMRISLSNTTGRKLAVPVEIRVYENGTLTTKTMSVNLNPKGTTGATVIVPFQMPVSSAVGIGIDARAELWVWQSQLHEIRYRIR